MFLPCYSQCTLSYLRDILSGKKSVLFRYEVIPVEVPYPQIITLKSVLEKVKEDQFVLQYLPDDPAKHVTKVWLFNVINSIDPSFFTRLVTEVEKNKVKPAV